MAIKHQWLIPKSKVYDFFEKLNSTTLTFGVHEEDNDKHAERDRVQKLPLHTAYYTDGETIGNASLLAKTESGFTTTIRKPNGDTFNIRVPSRPILKPLFESKIYPKKNYYDRCIGEAFELLSTAPIKRRFKDIAKTIDVREYIASQDWKNSTQTKNVKTFDNESFNDVGLLNSLQFIWTAQSGYYKEVLEDSGDLLNSIKTKVV